MKSPERPRMVSPGTSSSWASAACKTCQTASYTSGGTGITDRDTCMECPAGHECDGTSLTDDHKCNDDKEYSPGGLTTCLTCPQGSYTSGDTADNEHDACTACPAGYSCDGGSTKTACPAGTYMTGPSVVADFLNEGGVHTCKNLSLIHI